MISLVSYADSEECGMKEKAGTQFRTLRPGRSVSYRSATGQLAKPLLRGVGRAVHGLRVARQGHAVAGDLTGRQRRTLDLRDLRVREVQADGLVPIAVVNDNRAAAARLARNDLNRSVNRVDLSAVEQREGVRVGLDHRELNRDASLGRHDPDDVRVLPRNNVRGRAKIGRASCRERV